jgi:hypothetical protein
MSSPVLAEGNVVFALFIVGAILALVGAILVEARPFIERTGDYLSWARTVRLIQFVGELLVGIGSFLFLIGGMFGALRRENIPEGVRRTLLTTSLAFFIVWLVAFVVFLPIYSP